MRKVMSSMAVVAACLTALMFAPLAKAGILDYSCSGTAGCVGSVTETPVDLAFVGSGIKVVEDGSPAPSPNQGATFTLAFNTNTAAISLTGPETLSGTITSFSETDGLTTSSVTLEAVWPSLPADYAAYLGSSGGVDLSIDIFLNSNGKVTSSDTTITGAPEASTISLLGLVLLGGLLIGGKRVVA